MSGDSKAKVIPLHGVSQRASASRRHPSALPKPPTGTADGIEAVIREFEQRREAAAESDGGDLTQRIAGVADFIRKRLTGDYTVDEFGFDPQYNDAVVLPALRFFYDRWFRVEVSGIENLPDTGAGLIVANHAGTLPFDGPMLSVAVRDHHPVHRDLRLLAADIVFDMPVVGPIARRAGHTMACSTDANRLLAAGELTAVFPEGYKGLGKPFRDRYKLQRFGRGGFVSAALRAKAPIIPCSIVGSEEIYPMLADVKLLARVLGVPYFPVTPLFPLAGPLGLVPLPSKWHIAFGAPVDTSDYDDTAADDPMITFEITDEVRETIQQTLFVLLGQRRNTFFG
ncbi:lysophospholipid acyltransferase family protein [Mycolicibacterium sp.]|uniref:lysophospholipid acyltransferase family protein n=1 Tax=Mycolicibacterium sp. TaxID=2320850 RepID=UPI001A222066|nr:lysophospholipid acyltransferase family protein [Mycolicibacterium sp.]MBJ7400199.1 acyltransferase family protein [Mycolicibacterium sp.]